MKRTFPSVPQLYRNVRRWTEIVSTLSRYGLADWLSHVNIDLIRNSIRDSDGEILAQMTHDQRIRKAMTELGPTFIKLGQLMSTRPDVVGVELAQELTHLQADLPADPFESVRETIEQELGKPIDQLFEIFEERPIASASIGQVHRARLLDGREVVVKVRHTEIEKRVETDLDILAGLATLAERIDDLKPYQPKALVAEMTRTMRRELDFDRERRNLERFGGLLKNESAVEIPQPIASHCASGVLTMTEIQGTKLADCAQSGYSAEELKEAASAGASLYMKMIFQHGFYHADPHPGNVILLDEHRLGLIDFGMVGRINEPLREDIESMLMAIVHRDVSLLVILIMRVGSCPVDLDQRRFESDVEDFVSEYSTQKLSDFDMSNALQDFVNLVRRYRITLPAEVALLIKVLVTLEGTGRLLNPEFSLIEIMQPYQRRMMFRRLSPKRQMRKFRRFYMQVERLADSLPNHLTSILEQIQSGRFDVHLDHRKLGPTVNRLVMGMVCSALFLGSSWMLSANVTPVLFPGEGWMGIRDLSLLGLASLIASIVLGLRLYWAIRKSGNLDQEK